MSRRVAMRERPLNVQKRLQVIHGGDDALFAAAERESLAQMSGAGPADEKKAEDSSSSSSTPLEKKLSKGAAAMKSEASSSSDKDHGEKEKPKPEAIPIPPVKIVDDYEARSTAAGIGGYRMPDSYIKCLLTSGSGLPPKLLMYDVLVEDIEFLEKFNADNRERVSEDMFRSLIELFEVESYYVSQEVNCSEDYPLKTAMQQANQALKERGKIVEATYHYWISRRCTLNKALIREFQAPPPAYDPSPYVAFRPRNAPKRISHRNPRKNDAQSYDKLRILKKDFGRTLDLLERIKQRELIKQNLTQLSAEVLDAQLAESPMFSKFLSKPAPTAAEVAANPSLAEEKAQFDAILPLLTSPLPKSDYVRPSTTLSMSRKVAQRRAEAANRPKRPLQPINRRRPRDSKSMGSMDGDYDYDEEDEFVENDHDLEFYSQLQQYLGVQGTFPDAEELYTARMFAALGMETNVPIDTDSAPPKLEEDTRPSSARGPAPSPLFTDPLVSPSPQPVVKTESMDLDSVPKEPFSPSVPFNPPSLTSALSTADLLAPTPRTPPSIMPSSSPLPFREYNLSKAVVTFRGRIGRGGRYLIDRTLKFEEPSHEPVNSLAPDPFSPFRKGRNLGPFDPPFMIDAELPPAIQPLSSIYSSHTASINPAPSALPLPTSTAPSVSLFLPNSSTQNSESAADPPTSSHTPLYAPPSYTAPQSNGVTITTPATGSSYVSTAPVNPSSSTQNGPTASYILPYANTTSNAPAPSTHTMPMYYQSGSLYSSSNSNQNSHGLSYASSSSRTAPPSSYSSVPNTGSSYSIAYATNVPQQYTLSTGSGSGTVLYSSQVLPQVQYVPNQKS